MYVNVILSCLPMCFHIVANVKTHIFLTLINRAIMRPKIELTRDLPFDLTSRASEDLGWSNIPDRNKLLPRSS